MCFAITPEILYAIKRSRTKKVVNRNDADKHGKRVFLLSVQKRKWMLYIRKILLTHILVFLHHGRIKSKTEPIAKKMQTKKIVKWKHQNKQIKNSTTNKVNSMKHLTCTFCLSLQLTSIKLLGFSGWIASLVIRLFIFTYLHIYIYKVICISKSHGPNYESIWCNSHTATTTTKIPDTCRHFPLFWNWIFWKIFLLNSNLIISSVFVLFLLGNPLFDRAKDATFSDCLEIWKEKRVSTIGAAKWPSKWILWSVKTKRI